MALSQALWQISFPILGAHEDCESGMEFSTFYLSIDDYKSLSVDDGNFCWWSECQEQGT